MSLDFLDPGRAYTAQIYRDGDDASWQTQPHSIAIESRKVRREDELKLQLASGGGQVIRFVAERARWYRVDPTR